MVLDILIVLSSSLAEVLLNDYLGAVARANSSLTQLQSNLGTDSHTSKSQLGFVYLIPQAPPRSKYSVTDTLSSSARPIPTHSRLSLPRC